MCVYSPSALQSSEELSSCAVVLVSFLRDCYGQCFTQYSPRALYSHCHLLCMLARSVLTTHTTVWWKVLMAFLHNRAVESHEILSQCSHQ